MKPNKINMSSSKKSVQITECFFDIGTYVMAKWKNDFEYLAEVLAHRQRQGKTVEYRLRYVWDRVVEWTSANRLRKATQFEIDYVFKFCRDNSANVLGNKVLEKLPKVEANRSTDSLVSAEQNGVCSRPKRLRSTSVEMKIEKQLDGKLIDTNVRPRLSRNSAVLADEKRSINSMSLNDGTVEQDEMLYDKSIIQFSEACRKRRQLKRQAIEAELKTTDLCQSNVGSKVCEKAEDNVILKISKLDSPINSFESKLIVQPKSIDKLKVEDQSATSSDDLIIPKPLINVKSPIPCEINNDHLVGSPKPNQIKKVDLPVPSKTVPPMVFPCPHCPRRLRNAKLLSIHLRNYHKSLCQKSTNLKNDEIDWKSSTLKGIFQDSSTPIQTVQCGKYKYLVNCHRCGLNNLLYQSNDGLIQCDHCLRWFHRNCYDLAKDFIKSFRGSCSVIICDGCRLIAGPGRRSRQNEWQVSLFDLLQSTKQDGLIGQNVVSSKYQKLFGKILNILNQSFRLHPSLVQSRHILNCTTLPILNMKTKKNFAYEFDMFNKNLSKSVSNDSGLLTDSKNSEDQVNKLYMELRGIAFGNVQDPSSEINSFSLDCAQPWSMDESSDSIINSRCVDSRTDHACNIVNQDISGFFQYLDPDIIPEIANLNYDGLDVDDDHEVVVDACEDLFKGNSSTNVQFVNKCSTSLAKVYSPSLLTPSKDTQLDKTVYSDLNTTQPNRLSSDDIANVIGSPNLNEENSNFLYDESFRPAIARESMEHLNNQTIASDMMNLSLPVCNPTIMSDLFKSSIADEFPIPNLISRSQSLSKTNLITTEDGLDIDWLDSSNHPSHNHLTSDLNSGKHFVEPGQSKNSSIDHEDTKYTELPREHRERLIQVQAELDSLDNCVIGPLEVALLQMETELDNAFQDLDELEHKSVIEDHCWTSSDDDDDDIAGESGDDEGDTELPSNLEDLWSRSTCLSKDGTTEFQNLSKKSISQTKDSSFFTKMALRKLYNLQMIERFQRHSDGNESDTLNGGGGTSQVDVQMQVQSSTTGASMTTNSASKQHDRQTDSNINYVLGLGCYKTDSTGLITFSSL